MDEVALQLRSLAIVAFAALLGGAIGAERERSGKPAGLRTHMLVSASSALFALLSQSIVLRFEALVDPMGFGEWVLAIGVTLLALGIAVGLRSIEGRIQGPRDSQGGRSG
jgi:putative Mg2+ transporter-C (MgtC) family protein